MSMGGHAHSYKQASMNNRSMSSTTKRKGYIMWGYDKQH